MKTFAAALLAATALSAAALADPWIAGPEVVRGPNGGETITGHVFEDDNGDGRRQDGETGIEGVLVTNGLDVVRTDAEGRYEIAVREDMDLAVIQPSGWRVPVNERLIPQFSHVHKARGSQGELRFGGLQPSGSAPETVNFPLRRAEGGSAFTCAVVGDSQAYSNDEIGQFRDSAVMDLIEADLGADACLFYIGDVVGDDLGLLDRIFEIGASAGAVQWAIPGNHDLDFDAVRPEDSVDSWRRIWGPAWFAFETGDVTVIGLNNIVYPCGPEDVAQGEGREQCEPEEGERPRYNARISDVQMAWVENLLAETPEDRLIVVATHAPLVSFADAGSAIHQTDNAVELHALLEGRPALSISGHTHTLENMAPGEHFEGWQDAVGVGPLPFRHIVAGAASGNWWQGDFNLDGDAQALQRDGAPKGVLMLDFDGADYVERYQGARMGGRGQWLDFNTPDFRQWFETLESWRGQSRDEREPVPPVTVNDLPDTRTFTPEDLEAGVWATVNFWHGSAEATVTGRINDGEPFAFERTQSGDGEAVGVGPDFADPYAVKRQATVGRYAWESRSGVERNQGFEAFRGSSFAGAPQPQTSVADRTMHLWRGDLPEDLPFGVHRLTVTSTDRNGVEFTDMVVFEVRESRLPARHRTEVWEDGQRLD
jgi:hypothetical protein